MRTPSRTVGVIGAAVLTTSVVAACATKSTGQSAGGTDKPRNIQIIVDTGPGGGSDLFARQIVKIASGDKLITTNWPVVSQPQGGGLGAMAFMKSKQSQDNFVAAFTSKWIVAGLSTPNAPAQLKDLTPIAEIADETQVIAAPANAPYDTMAGFIQAAKASPGKLVQTGGSINSVDNLIALQIEKLTGTSWKYLSFDDGGPRITALLRGDAQIDIGAESDFSDQIAAHKLKLIGIVSDSRLADQPNVSTLKEQGVDLGNLPVQLQFRGIAGPPNMPPAAVKYYQDLLQKLVQTPQWTSYLQSQGLTPHFVDGKALTDLLSSFTGTIQPLVASLAQSGS
jgi:putative tricarboxylic transport membrane protein